MDLSGGYSMKIKKGLGNRSLAVVLVLGVLLVSLTSCQVVDRKPRARYGAAMVWDASENQMVLFGGRAKGIFGEKVLNDTWLLNLEDQTWRKVPAQLKPPPRLTPGMVIDTESRQLILFGGLGKDQRFGDTWIFDLQTSSWEEITPSSSPSPRSDVGMALAEEEGRALLFGGYCQEFQRENCAETWEFDLDNKQWTRLETEDSPPMTYGLQVVFDPHAQRFLQWGGHMAGFEGGMFKSLGYSDLLWSYSLDGEGWLIIPPEGGSRPSARYWHQLVYNPLSAEIILIGGDAGQGFLSDTWIYHTPSNRWRYIKSEETPAPRVNAAAAYHTDQGRVYLFGGLGEEFHVFGDLWSFSSSTNTWIRYSQ
jgi:N-acetylneuraminic acid mutarotase